MSNKLVQCRFCENFDPYEGAYWDNSTTLYMCYTNKKSCECGIDYTSDCEHFKLCSDLKEVLK